MLGIRHPHDRVLYKGDLGLRNIKYLKVLIKNVCGLIIVSITFYLSIITMYQSLLITSRVWPGPTALRMAYATVLLLPITRAFLSRPCYLLPYSVSDITSTTHKQT